MSAMAWGSIGGAAAALVAKKRKILIGAFERECAFDIPSAKPLEELDVHNSLLFRIQQAKGVIVDVGDGRYYLDRVALARANRTRHLLASSVAASIVILVALLWMLR